jgi:hypothetical protein
VRDQHRVRIVRAAPQQIEEAVVGDLTLITFRDLDVP